MSGEQGRNLRHPNSVTSIGEHAFANCGSLTSVALGNSVTSIGEYAFLNCSSLANATLGSSLIGIGNDAFGNCGSLIAVYCHGNAPNVVPDEYLVSIHYGGSNVFSGAMTTVYYLPGTTGWAETFADNPTAPWVLPNPRILSNGPSFEVQTNGFGFIISWATNLSVVVEACANLTNPIWSPVGTNTLTGGSSYFSDPQWTNYPGRFYRLRSP